MKTISYTDGDFCKPIKVNDWGYLGYFSEVIASDFDTRGLSDQKKANAFQAGDKILVRWPDGTVTNETIEASGHTVHVSDMGHSYTVSTSVLYVRTSLHGQTVQVPLETLWVKRA